MKNNKPVFTRIHQTTYNFGGLLRQYLDNVTEHWLLTAPYANPAMLEMFRDRDSPPQRELVPWAGEFAGKYLTSATQVLRLTGNPRLRSLLHMFVDQLLHFQDSDGYLGPWPQAYRLLNYIPYPNDEGIVTWDSWGHYHIMLGLLMWYEETDDNRVLHAVERIADLLCDLYLDQPRKRLVDTGQTEMNLAPVHSLCLLYKKTGINKYLDMALQIVEEFSAIGPDGPLAGDYYIQALKGVAFYKMPKPRWESLHPIMGLVELYYITGETRFKQAFERIWWSIVEFDRHNNGGFSSGEKASGNPYDRGPIETCCTIAWTALSVEMLKLSGNSIVADEIELSTLNSIIGMHSPSGRWATYNTPMGGVRRASAHTIVFQAREGSPELNCCSVNSPRGFGMLSDWAVMQDDEGVILNYYGPSSYKVKTSHGLAIHFKQETDYPHSGNIKIRVTPSVNSEFCLKLRIPQWSIQTQVTLNGHTIPDANPGQYLSINRIWMVGDVVELSLDMSLHFWVGEYECAGLTSVYRGPILLAFDHRYNLHLTKGQSPEIQKIDDLNAENVILINMPELDARQMSGRIIKWTEWIPPWILMEYETIDGSRIRLCDFGSAGATGTPYRTWLKILNAPEPAVFMDHNPLKSVKL